MTSLEEFSHDFVILVVNFGRSVTDVNGVGHHRNVFVYGPLCITQVRCISTLSIVSATLDKFYLRRRCINRHALEPPYVERVEIMCPS